MNTTAARVVRATDASEGGGALDALCRVDNVRRRGQHAASAIVVAHRRPSTVLHRRFVRRFLILSLASAATLQCGPSPSQPTRSPCRAISRDAGCSRRQATSGCSRSRGRLCSAPLLASRGGRRGRHVGDHRQWWLAPRSSSSSAPPRLWADGRGCPSSLSGTLTWRDDGIWFGTATDIPAPPCSARPFTHQVTLVRK